MNLLPGPGVAVAVLTETDESARAFRLDPARPVVGYGLITGDTETCRVHVLVENGRTLTSRLAGDSFYYESWLVTEGMPVSLGAFNAGPAGQANCSQTVTVDGLPLKQACAMRVTAEPFGGSAAGYRRVLEGELVWLGGATDRESPASEIQPELPPVGFSAESTVEPAPEIAFEPAMLEPAPEPLPWHDLESALVCSSAPEAAPLAGASPDAEERHPSVPPQPAPAEPEPPPEAEIGFRLYPEPATPVTRLTQPISVPLTSRHPMAPRATGSAQLHPVDNSLTITLRGLPSPASLGRERSTDRPFNAYRVWLIQHRSGSRLPLGHCTRVWGDNFKFESTEPLPLNRYDGILIAVDDRSQNTPNPNSPQVLLGTYQLS
ncbi:MAG: hypothetical protein ACM3XM_17605 [Mycobacterium leprae]